MSIYISCHSIDDLFAGDLLVQIRAFGFTSSFLCPNDIGSISENDIVILILRPEYIRSIDYTDLMTRFNRCTALPVLRAPIAVDDWRGNVVLSPVVDFTGYREEQINLSFTALHQILISCFNFSGTTKLSPQALYMNRLEIALQRPFFLVNMLEKLNYGCNSVYGSPLHALLGGTPFNIFSKSSDEFYSDNYARYRTDNLQNIAKYLKSYTVICEYLDSRLVAAYIANVVRQEFVKSVGKTPIPILLDIEQWNEESSWDKWLCNQTDFSQMPLKDFENGKLALYVYGFERSAITPHQFQQSFKEWWHDKSPTPYVVIVRAFLDGHFSDSVLGDIFVKPTEYNLAQLKQVCSKYSSRHFAQFVINYEYEDDESIPRLNYLVQNPIFAVALLSTQFEQSIQFHQQSIKNYFQHFIDHLWNAGNIEYDYSEVQSSLSKIAAVITEHQKSFIGYDEALHFVQSEMLLNRCIDVGLLLLDNNKLYFSMSIIQDYFTATALVQYGVPSNLPHLTLTPQTNRVPQRWDNPIIILGHVVAKPNELLWQIADFDPLLALRCGVSGIGIKPSIYSHIVEKNLEALVNIGDFRTDFARLLYTIDPITAKSILAEVLRNARWSVRIYAYLMFQELDKCYLLGLAESLMEINDNTQTKVSHAIRRIGSDSLSTLFQLLHHDDATIRLNAIWAIGELKDKACVPALVEALSDNNVTVSMQAAITLGTLQDLQTVPYLVKYLHRRHAVVRNTAINSLIEIHDKQPEYFTDIVRQMNPLTRRQVVMYLSNSKTDTLFEFFLVLSYDENPDVKIAAVEGLATFAEPRVISRLEECLEDMSKSRLNKSTVSEIVSRLLSNIPWREEGTFTITKSTDITEALNSSQIVKARLLSAKEKRPDDKNLLRDDALLTKSELLIAREDILEEQATVASEDGYVSDILTQLRGRNWRTGSDAAKTLRDYVKSLQGNTSSKVMNQILETLNDSDWVIRWAGVESLGWMGNVHVVPHLIQRLDDANWKVRVAAVRALAEIKDNAAIAGLSTLVSDDNAVVREAAAEALGFLDGKQTVQALESAALDPEDFVRLAAVESLGRIRDKVASSALLSALKDSSEHVRWAAANGLTEIADARMVSLLISSLSDTTGPYWEQKRICDVIVDILKRIGTEEARNALTEWQTSQV